MDLFEGMRTFAAVVDAGSFTAAADRLGISKKLASKYVAELEDRLGLKLLHRTTRSLSLSAAGHRYYPRCVSLIEELDGLEAEIRNEERGLTGTVRISAPVTFGELFVVPALARFRRDHPELDIDLRLNDRYVDLAGEGFDLAIRIGELDDSSLVARKLGQTELWAVAAPSYLSATGTPRRPHNLRDHVCLRDSNLRGGHAWPFTIEGQLKRVTVQGGFAVNSATAVRELALSGGGVALLPAYVVADDVAAGRLSRILEDYPSITLGIHAVFLDPKRLPARARAALDALSDHFKHRTLARSSVHNAGAKLN